MRHLSVDEARTRVAFGVVAQISVPMLLGTVFIYRCVKPIFSVERKVVRVTLVRYPSY